MPNEFSLHKTPEHQRIKIILNFHSTIQTCVKNSNSIFTVEKFSNGCCESKQAITIEKYSFIEVEGDVPSHRLYHQQTESLY